MSTSTCAYAAVGGTSRLRNKVSYMLRDPADADDVMQDACVKILEAQRESAIQNVSAFFYRIANNIAIDRMRRRYRTNRIFVAAEENEDIKIQLSRISCSSPRQDAQFASRQVLDVVYAQIELLPPKCARAYILNCVGDATYSEIAAELQVTSSMVEKYIARARRHIRATCGEIYSELN